MITQPKLQLITINAKVLSKKQNFTINALHSLELMDIQKLKLKRENSKLQLKAKDFMFNALKDVVKVIVKVNSSVFIVS